MDGIPPGACDFSSGWELHAGTVFSWDPALLDGLPGDPSVLSVEGGYVMYYGATPGDFSAPNTIRIFRATSTDGLSWQRSSMPVLTPQAGSWDSVKVETPNVIRLGDGSFAMFYSGTSRTDELGFQIGIATSVDGENWSRPRPNPVLMTTSEEASLIGPSVIHDTEQGVYFIYYAAISPAGTTSIFRATSVDGYSWTDRKRVMDLDIERKGSDDLGVIGPEVVKVGLHYEMVYNSLLSANAISGGIHHARSIDGIHWAKSPDPIRVPSGGSAFDADEVGSQSLIFTPNGYRLYFVGTRTDRTTYLELGFGLLTHPCIEQ